MWYKYKLHKSSYFRSVNKHGHHRQFLFLIGWFLKNLLLLNRFAKWTETWWEAPMEGSVLCFLIVEWKVSNTGSAHWASSFRCSINWDWICYKRRYKGWWGNTLEGPQFNMASYWQTCKTTYRLCLNTQCLHIFYVNVPRTVSW